MKMVNMQNLGTEKELLVDEITYKDLFLIIWKSKLTISITTIIFLLGAVFFALQMPNIYKSEVLLAPSEKNDNSGLAGLTGQLGGMASLAGINLGSPATSNTQLAIEVIKSRQFIANFIEKYKILPDLIAAESWSLASNTLSFDADLYDPTTKTWVREVSPPYTPKPSTQEAYKVFMELFNVMEDPDTGMVQVSIEHLSPFIAQQWVNWLIVEINKEMKERDVAEALKSTEFLTEQLEQTKVVDIRAVLYKLVEEQARTIMLANVRDEYVFKTIDPAIAPQEKSKPSRALICLIGLLLGFLLSSMVVVFRHFNRQG